jgi:tRNA (guanine10-N2)-dimethyltransferase
MSPRIFFIVSGEHPSLPFAELKAIIESEQLPVENLKVFQRVLSLQTCLRTARIIAARSSYVQQCCLELCQTPLLQDEILSAITDVPIYSYLKAGESFAVRVQILTSSKLHSSKLETVIGREISNRVPGARVNLKAPTIIFQGVLVNSVFLFGIRLVEVERNRFDARKPINRPMCHPSTMPPKLARCLVNLARVSNNSLVLDPFCGTGAFLIEAGVMGCRVIGCDINDAMIQGCRRNLKYYNILSRDLIVGDARSIAFTPVDSVVTDPPYGRAASRRGIPIESLVLNTLTNLDSFLSNRGYVVLAVPQGFPWQKQICDIGYSFVEAHFVREHKSLTREILIFNRR